jgi:hypothetical protein
MQAPRSVIHSENPTCLISQFKWTVSAFTGTCPKKPELIGTLLSLNWILHPEPPVEGGQRTPPVRDVY